MDYQIVIILLISGFVVGFINTLSAGATVISMTVYMALGLPIIEASGTNRIAVVLQNITSSLTFRKQNLLDIRSAIRYAVPIIIGTLIGAQFSMMVSNRVFNSIFAVGLVLMGVLLFIKPQVWLKGTGTSIKKMSVSHFILLVVAGIYGGSVYVGVGYFFIAVFVIGMGYDLIRANALKGFMAFATTPFSLVIYMMYGQVNYTFGLIHAVGNIVGAYFAATYASRIGTKFIRYLLLTLIIVSLIIVIVKEF
ncbi:MAG: sulfite exporter TauE/SafE family protein [Rikenellaceae bacterium]